MSESLPVIMAFVMGVLLGTFFYGGLWWTIQKGVSSKQPALLFTGSLVVRTLIALAGFYFVSRGDWRPIAGLPRWICDCAHPCDVVYANSY